MDEITITRQDGPSKGRYVAKVEGVEAEGELIYSRVNPQLVIAEHTEVPDALRGRALGRALIARLVEDARVVGFKIIPLCPYTNAERQMHSEWADVFQN
jgi:predicted GNAT family acetyltransferase